MSPRRVFVRRLDMSDSVLIVSKIKVDRIADVRAAVANLVVALEAAQPGGLRYMAWLLPDGVTAVVLRQIDDGVENPLPDLPEYQKLLDIVEGSRAAPVEVQPVTVMGSYRSF